MATAKWIGASANIRQKDLITLSGTGDWVSTDAITITIANVSVTITLGASSLFTDAQVATTIQQAWEGTTLTDTSATLTGFTIADGGIKAIPQFSEFTATVSSNVVSLLANGSGALAGKPVTMTVTESVTGDETAAESTSVTAVSQYHANQVDNWHLNAVPGNGDTVIFDAGSIDCRYLLDLGAIAVTQFTKYKAYSGNIGLAKYNTDNSSKPYAEYRTPTYLTADGFTNADLEVGEGPGSSRLYLDGGAVASTYNIYGKGARAETGVPCVLLLGTSITAIRNLAGDVGVAFYGGEVSTITTIVTGDGPTSQASTVCGSGCTLTTVTCNGGTLETNSAITTLNVNAGTVTHKSGTVTTLNQYDGTVYPNGAATITTLNLYGGTFDCRKGNASFTITNTVQLYKGAKFYDPQGRTGNVVFKLNACTFDEVTVILPDNKTFTPS